MAFHGDFFSYPLPELLQWLDSSRKTGALQMQWEAGERKVFLLAGQVVATAAPALFERMARALEQGGMADGPGLMNALRYGHANAIDAETGRALRELAAEDLFGSFADLTRAESGRFHWTEDPDRGSDEWVALEMPLRHVLFESLRWIDEVHDVERVLPSDTMVVCATAPPNVTRATLPRLLLRVCANPINLGRLRLLLGLPRSLVARGLYELLRAKLVEIDGAPELEADPVADMLEKGALLLRERQFEAASLIFSSLLQSDPSDRRVREFARMVEREHVASLYRELPPVTVLSLNEDPQALAALRQEDRQVAALINGRLDVTALVLASQQRELDTLKTLFKFRRMGLVEEHLPEQGN